MSLRLLAAGLVIALPIAVNPSTAAAADLYDPFESGYSGSPYDDPRYADIYRTPKPYHRPYSGEPPADELDDAPRDLDAGPPYPGLERYAKPHDKRPYGWSDRHRWRGEYLEPLPPPPAFDTYHPRKAYLAPSCLPHAELHRELVRDGWSDFHDFSVSGKRALVNARRPNGTLYRLEVDRCAGEVVSASRIDGAPDAYAWRGRGVYPKY